MSTPVLEFTEHKTPYGISILGVMKFSAITTLPTYKQSAIDNRKISEEYITSTIVSNYVRLRGEHKLYRVLANLRQLDNTEEACELLEELLHELRNPQIELKGQKQ